MAEKSFISNGGNMLSALRNNLFEEEVYFYPEKGLTSKSM
jgi:hypothetical protein